MVEKDSKQRAMCSYVTLDRRILDQGLLGVMVEEALEHGLLSEEHFTVDGTDLVDGIQNSGWSRWGISTGWW